MSEQSVPPRSGRRPGGRSARIRDSVFATTLTLLEQHGVTDLSVGRIAAEAGVAETTIYRRWGSLPGVIAAALSHLAISENPIPDTGSLERDLSQLLGNVTALLERPGVRRIFRFAMSLEEDDSELARARTAFWQTRFAAGTAIVQRAIERGEIPALDDPQTVIEVLVGPVYIRTFLLESPLTTRVLDDAVRAALRIAQSREEGPITSAASEEKRSE